MKKTYKVNNVEISAEQIKKLVKDNPEILEEKKVEGRFFFPKLLQPRTGSCVSYFFANPMGEVCDGRYIGSEIGLGVYKTQEQAEKEIRRRRALVRIRKYVTENGLLFEPDWNDIYQSKFCAVYVKNLLYTGIDILHVQGSQYQFELPYFPSSKKAKMSVEACEEDYLIYFGKK